MPELIQDPVNLFDEKNRTPSPLSLKRKNRIFCSTTKDKSRQGRVGNLLIIFLLKDNEEPRNGLQRPFQREQLIHLHIRPLHTDACQHGAQVVVALVREIALLQQATELAHLPMPFQQGFDIAAEREAIHALFAQSAQAIPFQHRPHLRHSYLLFKGLWVDHPSCRY